MANYDLIIPGLPATQSNTSSLPAKRLLCGYEWLTERERCYVIVRTRKLWLRGYDFYADGVFSDVAT